MSEFNYKDEVNKIVCSLENEKNKILTWQKLISSIDFNTYKPTKRQWQKLMLINEVRCNSKLTSKLISNIFPEAKDIELRPNYVHFKLNDFNCMISTSALDEVYISGKYKKDYNCFEGLSEETYTKFINTMYDLLAFHNRLPDFFNIDAKRKPNIIPGGKLVLKAEENIFAIKNQELEESLEK